MQSDAGALMNHLHVRFRIPYLQLKNACESIISLTHLLGQGKYIQCNNTLQYVLLKRMCELTLNNWPIWPCVLNCILTVRFGSAFWQCILAVHFGIAFWQCFMAMHFGSAFWQCFMAMHFGSAFWQCVLAVPFVRAFWQCVLSVRFGSLFLQFVCLPWFLKTQ